MTESEYSIELRETIYRAGGALGRNDPSTAMRYLKQTVRNVIRPHDGFEHLNPKWWNNTSTEKDS